MDRDVGIAHQGRELVGDIPGAEALYPQCQGMPTWWTVLPSMVNARMRRVTRALARTAPRGEEIFTKSRFRMPFSWASSGLISTNSSGWSSASHGIQRLMAPAR